MENKNFITIQGWMINDLQLKGNELIIYAIIYGFSQDAENHFTGNLQYLADWTLSTKQGVIKNLKSLMDKGLIGKIVNEKNRVRLCEYYVTEFNSIKQSLTGGIKQSLTGGIKQSLPNNIKEDNIIKDKEEEKEKKDIYNISKKENENCTTGSNKSFVVDLDETYNKLLNYCREDCKVLYDRYNKKINNGNLNGAREVMDMLEEITETYTDEQLRALFKKANGMYWIQPKYQSIDFAYMLNHLNELQTLQTNCEQTKVEEKSVLSDYEYFKKLGYEDEIINKYSPEELAERRKKAEMWYGE